MPRALRAKELNYPEPGLVYGEPGHHSKAENIMGVMDRLTDAALDAFEDELKCWHRQGTWHPKTTRLIRCPSVRNLGPAEYTADLVVDSVEQIELPDDQVHMFIVRAAMEKAVKAVREELGR